MIYWIGNSENWDKPIHPTAPLDNNTVKNRYLPNEYSRRLAEYDLATAWGDAKNRYVFPLVEETVLEVAFSPLYQIYKRLSKYAAVNCTSRLALRTALPTELNPKWQPMPYFGDGIVVKAPASCQNQGIGFALPNEYSRRLSQYTPEVGLVGIVEQYVPGPQYEADGVVIGGQAVLLGWSQQESENGKIAQYIRLPIQQGEFGFEAPTEVIETVVKALGLDNCPFCFEMKRETDEQGQWKIIDAHARLGEDRRLWGEQAELFDSIDKIIQESQQPSQPP